MLSWPTGGGHGRSLITLISTASVFPPNVTSQGRGGRGGGKRKVDARGRSGKKEMSGSREHKRKEKRKSERNTVAKDASIVIQSQLTM